MHFESPKSCFAKNQAKVDMLNTILPLNPNQIDESKVSFENIIKVNQLRSIKEQLLCLSESQKSLARIISNQEKEIKRFLSQNRQIKSKDSFEFESEQPVRIQSLASKSKLGNKLETFNSETAERNRLIQTIRDRSLSIDKLTKKFALSILGRNSSIRKKSKLSDFSLENDMINNSHFGFFPKQSNQGGNSLDEINTLKRMSSSKKSHDNIIKSFKSENICHNSNIERCEEKENLKFYKFKNIYDSLSENEFKYKQKGLEFIGSDKIIKKIWDFSILVIIFYTSIISPYIYCDLPSNLSNYYFQSDTVFDILFIFDIILSFYSPFYDLEENIVNELEIIRSHYYSNWMIPDLIISIPFSTIISILNAHESNLLVIFRCFQWIRTLRVFKLFNFNWFDFEFSSEHKINQLIYSTIYFFILMHIASCFWIFLSYFSFSALNISNSWITQINYSNKFDIYVASYYWNIYTIFTIGYGDIYGQNIIERLYNSFYMMVGVMLFSYTISDISTLFTTRDKKEIEFNKKCETLDQIWKEYSINETLYHPIKKFLKYLNKKTDDERFHFIEDLPLKLKCELSKYMFTQYIKEMTFFKNQSQDFILFVLPFLRNYKVKKNFKLVSTGEFFEEMYFVIKGSLSLQLNHNITENIELAKLRVSQHFGDLFLETNQPSPYDLVCKNRFCEFLVLKKENFLRIKTVFPEIIIGIMTNSYLLLEKINEHERILCRLLEIDNGQPISAKLKVFNNLLALKYFDEYYGDNYQVTKDPTSTPNGEKQVMLNNYVSTPQDQKKTIQDIRLSQVLSDICPFTQDLNIRHSKKFRESLAKSEMIMNINKDKMKKLSQQNENLTSFEVLIPDQSFVRIFTPDSKFVTNSPVKKDSLNFYPKEFSSNFNSSDGSSFSYDRVNLKTKKKSKFSKKSKKNFKNKSESLVVQRAYQSSGEAELKKTRYRVKRKNTESDIEDVKKKLNLTITKENLEQRQSELQNKMKIMFEKRKLSKGVRRSVRSRINIESNRQLYSSKIFRNKAEHKKENIIDKTINFSLKGIIRASFEIERISINITGNKIENIISKVKIDYPGTNISPKLRQNHNMNYMYGTVFDIQSHSDNSKITIFNRSYSERQTYIERNSNYPLLELRNMIRKLKSNILS